MHVFYIEIVGRIPCLYMSTLEIYGWRNKLSSINCTFDEEMNKVVTMERGEPKYLATLMIATRANLLLDKFLARTSKQDNSHN